MMILAKYDSALDCKSHAVYVVPALASARLLLLLLQSLLGSWSCVANRVGPHDYTHHTLITGLFTM